MPGRAELAVGLVGIGPLNPDGRRSADRPSPKRSELVVAADDVESFCVGVVEVAACCGGDDAGFGRYGRCPVRPLWLEADRGPAGSWGQNSASRVRAWCAIGVRADAGEEVASGVGPVDRA